MYGLNRENILCFNYTTLHVQVVSHFKFMDAHVVRTCTPLIDTRSCSSHMTTMISYSVAYISVLAWNVHHMYMPPHGVTEAQEIFFLEFKLVSFSYQ